MRKGFRSSLVEFGTQVTREVVLVGFAKSGKYRENIRGLAGNDLGASRRADQNGKANQEQEDPS